MVGQNDDLGNTIEGEYPASWEYFGDCLRNADRPQVQRIVWHFEGLDDLQNEDPVLDLFRQCRAVRVLVLGGNLPRPLAQAISLMTDLRVLDLGETNMQCLPLDWHFLRNLRTVVFGNNGNIEMIPSWIGREWKSLEELDLSRMQGITRLPYNITSLDKLAVIRHNQYFGGEVYDARANPLATVIDILPLSQRVFPTVTVALFGDERDAKGRLLRALCPYDETVAPQVGHPNPPRQGTTEVQGGPWFKARLDVLDLGDDPNSVVLDELFLQENTLFVLVLSVQSTAATILNTIQGLYEWLLSSPSIVVAVTANAHQEHLIQDCMSRVRNIFNRLFIQDKYVVSAVVGAGHGDVSSVLSIIADEVMESAFENSRWFSRIAVYHTAAYIIARESEGPSLPGPQWRISCENAVTNMLPGEDPHANEVLDLLHHSRMAVSGHAVRSDFDDVVFLRPSWVASKWRLLRERLIDEQAFEVDRLLYQVIGQYVIRGPVIRQRRYALLKHFLTTIARLPWESPPHVDQSQEFWLALQQDIPEDFEGILNQG